YGQSVTIDDVKNAVSVNLAGSTVTVEEVVEGTVPQATGVAKLRLTTSEGVTTVVDVPITYTNESPVVTVPGAKTILKQPTGQPTSINLAEGVTVSDREDDRSPTDNLATTVTYEILDGNGRPVMTVPAGSSTTVDVGNLPAGDYTVRISALDSGGTQTVTGSYLLRLNDNTPPVITATDRTVDRSDGSHIDLSTGVTIR
ncbi:TPA: hypothetical protein ACGPAN_002316, partial [Streptococcus suis]